MLVRVGSRGQITIPKNYRKSLNIAPGDSIIITESEGQLYLRPVSETIFEMRGIIQADGPQDLEEILKSTKKSVAKKIANPDND